VAAHRVVVLAKARASLGGLVGGRRLGPVETAPLVRCGGNGSWPVATEPGMPGKGTRGDMGRPRIELHGWWRADNATTRSCQGHQACLRAESLDRALAAQHQLRGHPRPEVPAMAIRRRRGRLLVEGWAPTQTETGGWSRWSEAQKAEAREWGGSWGTRDNSSVAEIGERHLSRRVGGTPVPPKPSGIAGSGGPDP
jgi:hypothetical protein